MILRTLSFLLFAATLLLGSSCSDNAASGEAAAVAGADSTTSATGTAAGARFEWVTTSHDFGTQVSGPTLEFTYKFKNVGTEPLVIQEVKPSCGCTAPDYSRDPIPPGGEGFVKIAFDTNGKTGTQSKTVTVRANTTPPAMQLSFKAELTGGENS